MVGGQEGHEVRAPWDAFTFGWEHTANKSVDKRDAEKRADGCVGDDAEQDSCTGRPKTDVKDCFALDVEGLFTACP